jgi:hypothetical protein
MVAKCLNLRNACFILTAALVTTSFVLSGTLNTNYAVAASNTLFKEKFKGASAFANKISTFSNVGASAFETSSGTDMCAVVYQVDENTGTPLIDWSACGPAKLTIGSGLSSATFSATLTGFDFVSGTDKTVTVTGDLTATGKVGTTTTSTHINTRSFTYTFNFHGKDRPASGTLNFQGDISINIDDANAGISSSGFGSVNIVKN